MASEDIHLSHDVMATALSGKSKTATTKKSRTTGRVPPTRETGLRQQQPSKSTSRAIWHEDLAIFEVVKPRGDALRSMGSAWGGRTILHAEEGLWLVERGLLAVDYLPPPPSPSSTLTADADATTAGRDPPTHSAASNTVGGSDGFPKADARLEAAGSPGRGGHALTEGRFSDGSLASECSQDIGRQGQSLEHSGAVVSGVGGLVKVVESGSLFVPTGLLRETLVRARVPWECYRAYAELKRRSYVVRRRPEDAVEQERCTPRAAPLSWFGAKASQHDTDTFGIENVSTTDYPRGDGGGGGNGGRSNRTSNDTFRRLPVTFHAYAAPNSNFRKRDPGVPDFWVIVCRYEDRMPTHAALAALAKRAKNCATRAVLNTGATQSLGKGNRLTRKGDKREAGKTSSSPRAPNSLSNLVASCPAAVDIESGDSEEAGKGERENVPINESSMSEEATGEALGCGELGFGCKFAGIKLAAVTGEGGVHFFDVGVHDDAMDIRGWPR